MSRSGQAHKAGRDGIAQERCNLKAERGLVAVIASRFHGHAPRSLLFVVLTWVSKPLLNRPSPLVGMHQSYESEVRSWFRSAP
jgi:hypothetical protein